MHLCDFVTYWFKLGDWVQAVSKKDKKKKPTDGASASGNDVHCENNPSVFDWMFWIEIAASPATSPTHQAGKKADKKKKEQVKKEEEIKSNEMPIEKATNDVAAVQEVEVKAVKEVAVVPPKEVVVKAEPAKVVEKEKKKANEKPVAQPAAEKKEKNNNNANSAIPKKAEKVEAKPVAEKITVTEAAVNNSDGNFIVFPVTSKK